MKLKRVVDGQVWEWTNTSIAMSYDNRLSVAGVFGAKRRRWSRARPKHKSFPGSDFYRSLADILAARTGGNGKLPADLVHHPPIVMTAVVTGLCSCTRQLFVCWPGAGNQGSPNYWTLFHHHFPGWWRLHYSRGTTRRWGDWMLFIPDQCRIQHDDD